MKKFPLQLQKGAVEVNKGASESTLDQRFCTDLTIEVYKKS